MRPSGECVVYNEQRDDPGENNISFYGVFFFFIVINLRVRCGSSIQMRAGAAAAGNRYHTGIMVCVRSAVWTPNDFVQ